MKKIQVSLGLGLSGALFLSLAMPAFAQDLSVNANANANATVKVNNDVSVDGQSDVSTRATVTSSTTKSGNRNDTENRSATSTSTHGSVVSAFVKSLLALADREGGIGKEVREIAKEQSDSDASTTEAKTEVESRSSFKTLILGPDYKNLGVLRSEIAKTNARIEALKRLVSRATSQADKDTLNAQIKVLADEQVQLQNFVDSHESSFSLLGWFVKLFNK